MLFHGLRLDPEVIDLPFSGCGGGIAQIPSSAGQKVVFSFFFQSKYPTPQRGTSQWLDPAGAPGILTGQ
jgi:hypothetical protein